ncbi:MAG: Cof-type HAD-IIB family hydrolase [Lachnospiraceae bacterium]|nr:Cof-type HAD-IIB family hydrolase [Lachnospiraceae bacterium]
MNMSCKLLLFDLDGTLLQSDKMISKRTLNALKACRDKGILIGVSTSRSEQNSMIFLKELMPDILISSGGAIVKKGSEYIYTAEFSEDETKNMIETARDVCGQDCEITIDTVDVHYWNYKIDPKKLDQSWGDSIYTDFVNFSECALKMCVEIFDNEKAKELENKLEECDCIRFSDGYWYKFTKKNVTKENAIMPIIDACRFSIESIVAFGDDFADIGMLELCGLGVAMGNAIDPVKAKADLVIGSNDEDGIAVFIEENLLSGCD